MQLPFHDIPERAGAESRAVLAGAGVHYKGSCRNSGGDGSVLHPPLLWFYEIAPDTKTLTRVNVTVCKSHLNKLDLKERNKDRRREVGSEQEGRGGEEGKRP